MNLDGVILKAKRLLQLRARAQTHPQRTIARLEEAWRQADQYKKEHPLDAEEEAVFDIAILSHLRRHSPSDDHSEIALVMFSRRLDGHSDDYFESALTALRQFRVQRAEWRARPVKQVTIVPESDWQPHWLHERRLALLFEPDIAEDWHARSGIRPIFSPRWSNWLEFVVEASDFATDADTWRPNALDTIAIARYGELEQWRGSSFSIRESDSAMELWGQAYTSHAPINANISLACTTFDHLRHRLEAAARERRETDHLLLACGFTADKFVIPQPRAVGRNERLRDPVVIERDTPRIWFEIVRAADSEAGGGPMKMESLERWMAVET